MASSLPKAILPDNVLRAIKESKNALRLMKKVDPSTRAVTLFPGSDQVRTNMAFNILNVKPAEKVFDKASEILKRDFMKICLNDDYQELCKDLETRNLAAFLTTHATMEKLGCEKPELIPFIKGAAGIGVGLINALVFSKSMTFEDGLDLVRRQAKAMDKAAKIIPGAKLYVKVQPATNIRKVCQAAIEQCIHMKIPHEIAKCSVTKRIAPHLLEIAGHEEAIKYLEEEGYRTFKFRRMKRLSETPHAYHTELMLPAQQYIQGYINHRISQDPNYIKDPETCSVYSATSGRRLRWVKEVKKDLSDYPVKPILIEPLLTIMFKRPASLAQPNIYVLWDRTLLKNLQLVNLRARKSAKLFA